MSKLRSKLSAIRKSNENGNTLGEVLVAMTITAILMVMVTNIQITTLNAQVALSIKMDVSTTARLISSNLEYRLSTTPLPLNISSQGCEGEPVLMAQFPISVTDTTCLTVTGDSSHYFVTGVAHDTNKEVRFDFESPIIDLTPVVVLEPAPAPAASYIPTASTTIPTVSTTTATTGIITETTTFVDGTISATVVQTDGTYTTTQTTTAGVVTIKKGKGFAYGQAKKI